MGKLAAGLEKKFLADAGVSEHSLPKLGRTWGEMKSMTFLVAEWIIYGLGRKQIGIINAVANKGKTTFLRNLAISLVVGANYMGLVPSAKPRRIAYLDFEDDDNWIQADIRTMLASVDGLSESDWALIDANLYIIAKPCRLDGSRMKLSNEEDLVLITADLIDFKPDLIIVDTVAASCHIPNENDNSQVRKFVEEPLNTLANRCDAPVLASHHIGKQKIEGGEIKEGAHRGRGASAFGDFAKLTLNLDVDEIDGARILSIGKVKGRDIGSRRMVLNEESRWFTQAGTVEAAKPYGTFLSIFDDGLVHTKDDLVNDEGLPVSPATIRNYLKRALEAGAIAKVRHGAYQKVKR